MKKAHTHWASRLTFIMASAGAAIGLGNIWRFPYITGLNGGGAFVLLYLLFVFILGVPLMASEILVGRRGQKNPCFAFRDIAIMSHSSTLWSIAGMIPILAGFFILSYYAVISGWVLDYIIQSANGNFLNISADEATVTFNTLLQNPLKLLGWDTLIVLAIVSVIARGIHRGLEKAIYILFPLLIILAISLVIYATKSGSFWQGFLFLFQPDFSKLNGQSILLALGQAFFSLGIGTGIMLTYGTYVTKETSITETSLIISLMDTAIALVAGLTIFPIVFANHLPPDAGPSLIFKTLPVAFGHMPMGRLFSCLFFIMLEIAAFTSAFALLEPMVTFLREAMGWSRAQAAWRSGFALWILSLGSVASFNIGKHLTLYGKTFFDCLDFFTSNIMLPVGGLLTAIFTGWIMYRRDAATELQIDRKGDLFKFWRFSIRFLAPLSILAILIRSFVI